MKETYEELIVEVIRIEAHDVVTASQPPCSDPNETYEI